MKYGAEGLHMPVMNRQGHPCTTVAVPHKGVGGRGLVSPRLPQPLIPPKGGNLTLCTPHTPHPPPPHPHKHAHHLLHLLARSPPPPQVRLVDPDTWATVWRYSLLPGERALSVRAVHLRDTTTGATVPLLAVGAGFVAGAGGRKMGRAVAQGEQLRAHGLACRSAGPSCAAQQSVRAKGEREAHTPTS